MNSTIYRQADSRWGKKPYPNSKYTLSSSGCGCCSCTHVLMEVDKYKKYTPESIRPWMVSQGFATKGNGTTWNGITKTLQHYGFTVKVHPTMTDLFNTLNNRTQKWGIILFRSGSRGGVTWTTGGHFVAYVDYKVSGGKHYFYIKDSGSRHHDGWYCYETTMKGLIPQVWSAYMPGATPTPTPTKKVYDGQYPSATVSTSKGTKTNIKYWQKFLNWWGGFGLDVDGAFGSKTKSATKKFQQAYKLDDDGVAGPKTIKKAKTVGAKEKH